MIGCKEESKSTEIKTETVAKTEVIEPENGDYLVSCIKKLSDDKTYLEVDGHPFAIRGGQVRIDGMLNRLDSVVGAPLPLTMAELEEYFKAAKAINLNTLELSLDWRRIEPEKDVFDFTLVDNLLSLSNKYDLKCEFLWFSTNMCGDSHSFQLPDYIVNDTATYSRFETEKTYISTIYGEMFWLVINDPDLMERERIVLEKLMNHVYEWNLANGKKNPLIGIQVHNECDGLLRWRLEQRELAMDGVPLTPEFLWNVTLESLDNAGKAIKSSKYKIYTRCNMTVTFGVNSFPQFSGKTFSPLDVLALEGIDIVGDDPYSTNPSMINKTIREYSVNGNYPHIAENMGDYESSPSLFLSAYQAGGSYMFYDLATPEYFVFVNGNGSYHMDQGLLNPDLTYKAHTAETVKIISGISKMGSILPLVFSEDFAAFNIMSELPKTELEQTICTSSLKIKYKTNQGGIAFAIEHDEYVYLYSTAGCQMTIENASFTFKADIGYFNVDEYVIESSTVINPTITLEAEKLYRVKIRLINEEVSSTTNENV